VGEPVVTAARDTHVTASVDSPVGPLTVLASAAGLRAILWPNDVPGQRVQWPESAIEDHHHPVIDATRTQLAEYFAGTRRAFSLRLDLDGTPFQVKAWRALATIPYGTTTTYGDQARRLGDARWARAVGAANGRNPVSIVLPCHRIVGSTGALTGFAGGLPAKRALIDHECSVAAGRGPLVFPRRPS
jgi:methylated-DNA-[protein]-cysteine S-methyltransferase